MLARSAAAAGDPKEARSLHLRALSLASPIGHIAGVCEALEGLAGLTAAEGDFERTLRLLDAAQRERDGHALPRRALDRRAVAELRRTAEDHVQARAGRDKTDVEAESAKVIVAELLGGAPVMGR